MRTRSRPEAVVRAWFDAFANDDMAAARAILADNALLHCDQPPELAGDIRGGLDEFLDWYRRKRTLAGPGFAYEVEEIMGGERFAVALLLLRSGETAPVQWRQVAVYRVQDGQITEIWLHEEPGSAARP